MSNSAVPPCLVSWLLLGVAPWIGARRRAYPSCVGAGEDPNARSERWRRWLGPLVALVPLVLASACSHETAQAREGVVEGLRGQPLFVATPELRQPDPPPPDPNRGRRAIALTQRCRERIAHWTDEAGRLSKGKATRKNVAVAVCVRELGSDQDLIALRADEPQTPASNMKLVTTAAALILLGRSPEWVTPFEAGAPITSGELTGDLVVRAAGDPLWDPAGQGEIEGRIAGVARVLRASGLTRIRGDLVLDEGTFETPAPGPSWPDESQHWAEYCALSGGFSANGGVLQARVRGGDVGAPAAVVVHPSPHGLRPSYDVRTVAGTAVDVRVGATASTATVRGTLGRGVGEFEAAFAHRDPVALFGSLVEGALRAQGIQLEGQVRRARGTPRGVVLAELHSPLVDCLEAINAESKNGIADQVFLSLGQALFGQGTREGGAQAVQLALERLGIPARDLRQVDGSGLSRDDRVTARAITALLERVLGADAETARLYRDSLAVMGQKGTLDGRLRGTLAEGRVFAKTGWIAGVSSLSGYAELDRGREAVFSILIEYPSALGGLNTSCFKKLQDELVLLLFQEDA